MKRNRVKLAITTILLIAGLSIMPVQAEESIAEETAIQTETENPAADSAAETETVQEEGRSAESIETSPKADTEAPGPSVPEALIDTSDTEIAEIPVETPGESIPESTETLVGDVVTLSETQLGNPEPVQQEAILEGNTAEAEVPGGSTEYPLIPEVEPAVVPVIVETEGTAETTNEIPAPVPQEAMAENSPETALLPETTVTETPEKVDEPVLEDNDDIESKDPAQDNTSRKGLAIAKVNTPSAAMNAAQAGVPAMEGISEANENVSTEELSSHAAVYVIEAPSGTAEETTGYIQLRLDQAKNNQTEQNILIKILSGNYYVDLLTMYSNTDLVLSKDARMIRNNAENALLRGGSDGNATRNILVSGGVWEGTGTEGSGSADALLEFRNAFNITLHDLIIRNTAKTLLRIEEAGHVTVESVKFEGGTTGLKMINAENAVIRNNAFTEQAGNAAVITGSSSIEISENTAAYCYSGIELSGVTQSSITGNAIKYTEDGRNIVLKDGSVNNTVTGNLLGGSAEIITDNTSRENTIFENTVFLGELVQTEEGIKYQNNDRSYYKDGWKKVNGSTYYFSETTGAALTGWKKIDGKKYHFTSTGVMDNGWRKISGHQYHFTQGVMDTGWKIINGYTYYFNWKGVMSTGLTEIETKNYYFNDKGCMQTGWNKIDGSTYYFNQETGAALTGWKKIDGYQYHFKSTGVMDNGWTKISGHQYHFTNGVMDTGWKTINDYKYYFSSKGVMSTGLTVIGTRRYFFNDKGCMQTEWRKIDGSTYYFNPSTGAAFTGWHKINDKQYHFQSTGVMDSGWTKINGFQYHFTKGVMDTGWIIINNYKYFFNYKGVMSVGLTEINKKKYYFNTKGCMQTGWKKIDGSTYYFNLETGAAYTGWKKIDGKQYHFTNDAVMDSGWRKINGYQYHFTRGVMDTGWKLINKYQYHFSYKGVMDTGWKTIDGNRYHFNYKGCMSTGLISVDGKKYYFNVKGQMQTGWQYVNTSSYYFGTDGAAFIGTRDVDGHSYTFGNDGVLTSDHTTKSFLAVIKSIVCANAKSSGIMASLTAAQAILESASGNSGLTKSANNLFGIKGFYNGDSITLPTQEYVGGRYITEYDIFRKYPSWVESIQDHSDLFNNLSRYENLRNLSDYRRAATYVRQDGYATDPVYTLKLISLIKKYDLYSWDGLQKNSGYSPYDYDVITTSALNVRSTFSTSGAILTTLPVGTVVAVETVVGEWGKLADYPNAWICLNYAQYY